MNAAKKIQLEVGKTYARADGTTETITLDDNGHTYPFRSESGHWYMRDGRWQKDNIAPQYDLVAEVKDKEQKAQSLTLAAGKYYRTRDGRKAFVSAVSVADPESGLVRRYPAIGYIAGREETWQACGRNMTDRIYKYDLVAEWIEPKRIKGWVALGRDLGDFVRCTHIHPSKEAAIKNLRGHAYNDDAFACIEIDVLEGAGLEGEAA
ncbi:hypothetical protein [Rhizobium leguminosarum]|uniref:hypothetical protein n=1 Tax=Rhizobium leguminosarum TaxID=384 RepID=UPI0012FB0758|nr:hypothetical protein [Rhizobium leguminosarum]MVO95102.1 hypothetical protein [Rhizobium leguminosarum bv. phaseoli]